ncbi:MAG TPA: xanthine dehydrogenase family protein subunit M, partial [bacterium]|nr:xanthine dehydrogenase family protein subunit M [bacterium]
MTFAWHKPAGLVEAVALYGMNGGKVPILAGGTDIVVQWRAGAIDPPGFIDVSSVPELRLIEEDGDSLLIGAGATHSNIASNPLVGEHLPVLVEACLSIGATQIQNRGTIGGNIMNASPAGDTLPVAAAYDAQMCASSVKGDRWIPASEFYTGYRKTALASDEMLTRIRFPKRDSKESAGFYKVGTRRAQAISKVALCARARIRHGGIEWIKIAVGSVAPTVVRCPGTETLLAGKAINAALMDTARASIMDEVHPIDDVRSTAEYRRFVTGSLLV